MIFASSPPSSMTTSVCGMKVSTAVLLCDDLLNEVDAEPLREQKAARAGDCDGHAALPGIARPPRPPLPRWSRECRRGGGDSTSTESLLSSSTATFDRGGPTSTVVGAWLVAPAAACASAVIAFLSLVSAMLVPLHFDGFARFDEQQAHRDKCHFFGGLRSFLNRSIR